jgi:hypothetical protein
MDDDFLEKILSAADRHGDSADDSDMQIGDLQELARDLWATLTPDQKKNFEGRAIDWEEFIQTWKDSDD